MKLSAQIVSVALFLSGVMADLPYRNPGERDFPIKLEPPTGTFKTVTRPGGFPWGTGTPPPPPPSGPQKHPGEQCATSAECTPCNCPWASSGCATQCAPGRSGRTVCQCYVP